MAVQPTDDRGMRHKCVSAGSRMLAFGWTSESATVACYSFLGSKEKYL